MITPILDRIVTPSIIWLVFSYGVWSLRAAFSEHVILGLIGLTGLYTLYNNISAIGREFRISALGSRAPRIRWHGPYNIAFIVKSIYHFKKHTNFELWSSQFKKAGRKIGRDNAWTVETIIVGERVVITSDEENIKAILATQFSDYGKGPVFNREWRPFLGHSIFTTDGQLWHDSRALLRPQFIKDRVSDLHIFEHHVQTLLPLLKGAYNGATVRVDDLFFRYTLDAATDFLFGFNVDSLRNADVEFARFFGEVQHVQGIIARAGPMQVLVPKEKYWNGLKHMNAFIDRFIDEALAVPQAELEKKIESGDGYTFLHAIAGYTRNRQVLRDQIAAVLLAGRDTTAVSLSWLFYELSRHPRIVNKLRDEIANVVGLDPSNKPTYDNLKSMRYLQHTLNEVLRLYPVVPFNVRVALNDTTLPTGGGPDGTQPIGVLKNTPIGYSTFIMQRREDIYPPASESFPHYLEFAPERWDNWRPKALSYIPFNAGPRICIGQQFALTEMGYTAVRILQHFANIADKNATHPGFRTDIVLQPAHGVSVAFSNKA